MSLINFGKLCLALHFQARSDLLPHQGFHLAGLNGWMANLTRLAKPKAKNMCTCSQDLCQAEPVQSYAQGHTSFLSITLIGVLRPCAPAVLPDRRFVLLVIASASAARKPQLLLLEACA